VERSTSGAAKQVHLNRVAHVAGEAFAFVEPEPAAPTTNRRPVVIGGILWLMIGAAAAAALWVGF
jgi:hypothetical protein